MRTDKALRKALKQKPTGPSYGFTERVMRQILLESERASRRSYYRSLALVGFVCTLILVGSFAALEYFMNFSVSGYLNRMAEPFMHIRLDYDWSGQLFLLQFSVSIAFIILLLLGLEHFLRKRFGKL